MTIRNARPISKLAILTTLQLALLVLTGCIGVASHEGRSFETFPPTGLPAMGQTTVDVSVTYSATGMAAAESIRNAPESRIQRAIDSALQGAGARRGAGDYALSIQVTDQGGPASSLAAALLTGFTLYVIPSWATHEFTTQASITDAAGQSIATTTFKHRYRMYQQLFLLFGMPFAGVESVYDEMWTAVMQDVAVWTVESVRAP